MTHTAEQFISSNKTYVQALEELSRQTFVGVEKLIDLNLAASKDLMASAFNHTQAILNTKDARELLVLQAGYLEHLIEKSAAYGQHCYTFAASGGGEFSRAFETTVENILKNAPPGTETVVTAFKNAVSASQNIIETAQSSAKKAMDEVESNFTSGANQAAAAAGGYKKR